MKRIAIILTVGALAILLTWSTVYQYNKRVDAAYRIAELERQINRRDNLLVIDHCIRQRVADWYQFTSSGGLFDYPDPINDSTWKFMVAACKEDPYA